MLWSAKLPVNSPEAGEKSGDKSGSRKFAGTLAARLTYRVAARAAGCTSCIGTGERRCVEVVLCPIGRAAEREAAWYCRDSISIAPHRAKPRSFAHLC